MDPSFSARVPGRIALYELTLSRERLSRSGLSIVDLTESNPTQVGLVYPRDLVFQLLPGEQQSYHPESAGMGSGREAVARYLQQHGLDVRSGSIFLTASTSDAYGLLFKLLCDPNDEVLIPQPSYPLLDHLIRFESVVSVPYRLKLDSEWRVDLSGLEHSITVRTRAVVLVNPNNPTGSFVSSDDFQRISALCYQHGLALIVDEVFGFYPLEPSLRGPSVLDEVPSVLTFVLGGLSKAVGLPGLKLAWVIVAGPSATVATASDRLELICDTYLSVATPVQLSLGHFLDRGQEVTQQIASRVRENHACLKRVMSTHPKAVLLPVEGGWYAVIRLLRSSSEDTLVLELLEQKHVLVHPGYFYDFPEEVFLVISLLPEPYLFRSAVQRVLTHACAEEVLGQ